MTNDNLAHGIDQALTNQAEKPKRSWLKNRDGGAAFTHDPNDHLANGLQAQFEEYKKDSGRN